ncbi:MAG: ATP-binding protein [Pseudomonadota bacterium]
MAIDYEKLGAFYLGREFDPATKQTAAEPLLYDSRDLTTHAVCLGMTGSGKTGLCLALLEEAAIDGIPAICIDPKGDLGNLLLTFPALAAAEFEPWVDAGEAARKNLTLAQYAEQVAQQWKSGLAEWDQAPERIARLRAAVDITIYTPGSDSGLPISILQSFSAPPASLIEDTSAFSERVTTVASGLLTLLGRDADPLKSREHILLANILDHAWREGRSLDLAGLIATVQRPQTDKLGALDLETFFPAKDRLELAMSINNLLASPSFAAWTRGVPLDAQQLLFTPEGKPRIAIVSIAHLSDAERMFVVTLLLNEMIAWMRRQSGTSSLRAILYMDEIFGYFPPSANPPSKPPMLTLLKQARAYGVGCVLATQNPVDLDYKGLGNTGTWLIGRLQTERDRDRVLDGLTSALSGEGADRAKLASLMGALTQRVFLMRNVHDDAPVLLKSRWALSYLRGPLTPAEISRLMASRKQKTAAPVQSAVTALPLNATSQAAAAASAPITAGRPPLPAGIDEFFLPLKGSGGTISYQPRVLGLVRLHYIDAKLGLDEWQQSSFVAPLSDDGKDAMWAEATTGAIELTQLDRHPADNASFAELPSGALRSAAYTQWGKSLAGQLYQSNRLTLWTCDAVKLNSRPGETEGDFRTRVALALREQRDERSAELRRKYAPRVAALQASMQRAQDRSERERSQLSQQKLQTAISVGATVLGALFGRKIASATGLGRATTAARSATRIGRESEDVQRATESEEVLKQRLEVLNRECEDSIAGLSQQLDPLTMPLRQTQLAPRKSDITIGRVALLWTPWRLGADGFPAPAS